MTHYSRTCLYLAATAASVLNLMAIVGCKKESNSAGTGSPPTGPSGQAATVNAEPATPKAVTLAFSRALSAGDVARARSLSTGDAGPQTLDALAKLASATDRLQKALKAKFGDAALKLEIFEESPDVEEELNRSTETITGDTAVIRVSPTDKNPSELKKVNGQWKFDIAKFKASEPQIPELRKMASAWSDLAVDVTAGKFKTVDDFKKVFAEKTAAAAATGTGG
jgi:hypothetical protein